MTAPSTWHPPFGDTRPIPPKEVELAGPGGVGAVGGRVTGLRHRCGRRVRAERGEEADDGEGRSEAARPLRGGPRVRFGGRGVYVGTPVSCGLARLPPRLRDASKGSAARDPLIPRPREPCGNSLASRGEAGPPA